MRDLYYWTVSHPLFSNQHFTGPLTLNNLEKVTDRLKNIPNSNYAGLGAQLKYYERYADFPLKKVLVVLQKAYNSGEFKDTEELKRYSTVATLSTLSAMRFCLASATPYGVEIEDSELPNLKLTMANVKVSSKAIIFSVGSYEEDYTAIEPSPLPSIKAALNWCLRSGIRVAFKKISGFYTFTIKFDTFDRYRETAEGVARTKLEDSEVFNFDDPLSGLEKAF